MFTVYAEKVYLKNSLQPEFWQNYSSGRKKLIFSYSLDLDDKTVNAYKPQTK